MELDVIVMTFFLLTTFSLRIHNLLANLYLIVIKGDYIFAVDTSEHEAQVIFTDNETNLEKLRSKNKNQSSTQEAGCSLSTLTSASYTKDAFHEYIVNGY